MLALLLSAPLALGAPQDAPRVTLPEGPAARAWAGVGPETVPAELSAGDVPRPFRDAAWREEGPWLEWARDVRAEADAEGGPSSRRRARLALVAWAQGRSDAAWDHLAACTAEPEWMAAALPALLPGVSPERLAANRGRLDAVLPDGVILAPALPPPDRPAAEVPLGTGRVSRREMSITGVRVGAATLAITVLLEVDGVQVDVLHEAGGAARLAVILPEPQDFQIRVEYTDWFRQDTIGEPLVLEVQPGDEVHSLFGRFRPRPIAWPTALPAGRDVRLERDGLRLVVDAESPERGRAAGFARGLAELLGAPCDVRARRIGEPPEPFGGVTLELVDPVLFDRKLIGLVTLAERYVLAPR